MGNVLHPWGISEFSFGTLVQKMNIRRLSHPFWDYHLDAPPQDRGDLSAIALAKAEARDPTAPLLKIKRRGNLKVVTGAPPNEISVQLQPCEVPHSVQTPHAPVRMTLVLPQCEQLIPMYIFSRAARTRSACN